MSFGAYGDERVVGIIARAARKRSGKSKRSEEEAFRKCRNNMGNELILALPGGTDDFVVMWEARVRMHAWIKREVQRRLSLPRTLSFYEISGWTWSIRSTKSKARYETIARLKRLATKTGINLQLKTFEGVTYNSTSSAKAISPCAFVIDLEFYFDDYTMSLAARKRLWAVETVILYRASQDVVVQDLLRDALSARRPRSEHCPTSLIGFLSVHHGVVGIKVPKGIVASTSSRVWDRVQVRHQP
nr:hypothetical protein [Tanacetum cinerariifolium]